MAEDISRYKFITENTLDLLCETSADGRYTFLSPNYRDVLGYAPEEMLGHHFAEWLHPEDTQAILQKFMENMRALRSGQATFRYRRKDGVWRWLEATGKPISLENGEWRAIFVSRDVTDRVAAEENLARTREWLDVVINRAPVIIYAIDREGIFTLSEGKGLAAIGLKPGEAVGKSAFDLYKDIPEILANLRSALAGNTFTATVHVGGLAFESYHTPIRDETGAITGMFGFALDVTERRKTEEDRLRTRKLESLALLAGGIAHDFNNLLTGILGNLSLAEMDLDRGSSAYARLVETEKACLRARDLTVQLLTFSSGGAPVKKLLALNAMLRSVADDALSESEAVCEFSIAEDLWPVQADEAQLRQVIHNLVLNAMQAVPRGGAVRISARNAMRQTDHLLPAENCVEITVADDGGGIAPENLHRIFEPYFTTKGHGHGLGLAAAHSIIKNHGGTLDAASEPGKGATFRVRLPAVPQETAPAPPREPELRQARGRVLVMDDEELIRTLATRMLTGFGYEVECAAEGGEALAKYCEALDAGNPFDAVILDLTIQDGLGGLETLQELRVLDPNVRAIVSSGYSSNPVMAEPEAHGVAGVVPKPYRTADLVGTVQRVLGGG